MVSIANVHPTLTLFFYRSQGQLSRALWVHPASENSEFKLLRLRGPKLRLWTEALDVCSRCKEPPRVTVAPRMKVLATRHKDHVKPWEVHAELPLLNTNLLSGRYHPRRSLGDGFTTGRGPRDDSET